MPLPPLPDIGLRLAGVGSYLPERILTNAELEKLVQTTDDWIVTRTGIRERHIAAKGELASDMGAKAAQKALAKAGMHADEIDLIITASVTPDMTFPSTACLIQDKIGATKAAAFDLQAACSGFLYSLVIASTFIRTGSYKNILVVGTERPSSILNWTDRNTCILFGDGAGAAIVQASQEGGRLISWSLGADGRHGDKLYLKNSWAARTQGEPSQESTDFLVMNGKEIFKLAVNGMVSAAQEVLSKADCTVADVRCVIPHQANIRIIDAITERLEVPKEKCFVNLQNYGNISSACIPIALEQATAHYSLKKGDKILLLAFGGGLTWAAILWEL